MTERTLNLIEIFDWYDGPVIALARASWRPGVFIASLLAWDLPAGKRVLALIPISSESIDPARDRSDWSATLKLLARLAEQVTGEAVLICTDDLTHNVVSETQVAVADVRPDLFGAVDDALAPDRHAWFSRVGG